MHQALPRAHLALLRLPLALLQMLSPPQLEPLALPLAQLLALRHLLLILLPPPAWLQS
jgi:hypothetical protein